MFNRKKRLEEVKDRLLAVNSLTVQLRDQLYSNNNGVSHNGKRSTYDVYGYPKRYSFELGYSIIRREGVGNRVARGIAASCWRDGFVIREKRVEEELGEVVLCDELTELRKKGLFKAFERADTLARIGDFSVLFVGVPDGLDFQEPVGKVRGDGLQSIYFRPFAYDGVQIARYDMDIESPRYGMPELYQLQVMGRGDTDKTQSTKSILAHHTRVVHLAEGLLDSDIEGVCAIEPIYNRLLDLDKATGGSAEAYFRNARGKVAFEVDPAFSADLLADDKAKKSLEDAGSRFINDWQDQIFAVGSKVKAIDTIHNTPLDTIKTILWSISGHTGIPVRVLTGEGAGQLAGSEDRLAYGSIISDRQKHVCGGWAYDLLDILQTAGILQLPEGYEIEFPLEEPLNQMDEADLGNKRADTLRLLTEAASSVGGDAVDLKSALMAVGLQDVEIEVYEPLEETGDVLGDEMNPPDIGDADGE